MIVKIISIIIMCWLLTVNALCNTVIIAIYELPISYMKDNKITGIGIQIAKRIQKEFGDQTPIKLVSKEQAYNQFNKDTIIIGVRKTDKFTNKYHHLLGPITTLKKIPIYIMIHNNISKFMWVDWQSSLMKLQTEYYVDIFFNDDVCGYWSGIFQKDFRYDIKQGIYIYESEVVMNLHKGQGWKHFKWSK